MYAINIKEPGHTLVSPNGKLIRTPQTIQVKNADELHFWITKIKSKTITMYEIIELEKPEEKEEPNNTSTFITPIRPSRKHK